MPDDDTQAGRAGPGTQGSASPRADAILRQAAKADCLRIAALFRISSEGIADYIWSSLAREYPGISPLEIGRRRYEREGTAFSYQNCLVAERRGEVVGMAHAFVIEAASQPPDDMDPVLRPYAELEVPGSLYLSGLAVLPGHRGQGLGSALLTATMTRARSLGVPQVSLICFAQNTAACRLYERHGFAVVDQRQVVPHPLIHARGEALLMTAPV